MFGLRVILPITALPLLSHTIGADGLGSVIAGQSLGLVGGLIVQFGFHQSATRDIGAERDPSGIGSIVYQVIWAQMITCIVAAALVIFAALNTAAISSVAFGPISIALITMGTGLSPAWYYRGTGRPQIGVLFELVGQLVTISIVIALVKSPDETPLALAAFWIGPILLTAAGLGHLLYEVGKPFRPTLRAIYLRLRASFPLFLVRVSSTGFTMGAAWLASLLTGPRETAYFGVAAKIAGALTTFSQPVLFALLPAISREATTSRAGALKMATKWGGGLLVLGLSAAIGVQIFADLFIDLLFSADMAPAAGVTRALAWICVVAALRDTLGDLVLVPLHRDRTVAACVIAGSGAGLAMAFWLAPLHGAYGMVWARISGEIVIAALMALSLALVLRSGSSAADADGTDGGAPR